MFGEKKRSFKEIQLVVLRKLRTKQKTIYQIAKQTKTHFRTIRHQLILLKNQGYVNLVFELDHIRVFAITKQGYKYLRKLER
jgi:predicted transcriptional regulator